jgi:V/A-type H+-transporting ATPase subunit I
MLRPARMAKGFAVFPKESLTEALMTLQALGHVQFFDIKEVLPELHPLARERTALLHVGERVDVFLAETYPEGKVSLKERVLGSSTIPVVLVKHTGDPLGAIKAELEDLEDRWTPLCRKREEAEAELRDLEKRLKEEEERLFREAFLGPGPGEYREFGSLVAREEVVKRQIADLEMAMRHFSRYARPILNGIKERIENLLELDGVRGLLGSTPRAVVIGFWVPQKKVPTVERALRGATGGACVIDTRKPDKGDHPPVLLENPWFLKPYEILTTNYGYPRYDDLDPTPFLAITFTMLFGLMFADVGYGLALFLLSIALYLKSNRVDPFMRDLNIILAFAGTASITFGFVFGEFFGGLVEMVPLWWAPMDNLESLLYLSLLLGAIHISVSLFSRFFGEAVSGRPPLYPLSLLIIMWSFVWFVIVGWTLAPLLSTSFAYGLLCLVKTRRQESMNEVLALVVNIISYARVGALFILHVVIGRVLASVLFSLSPTPVGLVIGVIVFVAGASVILVSSALFVFIHSLRLHWIEFFRRFYSGLGRGFEPFALKGEHVIFGRKMA